MREKILVFGELQYKLNILYIIVIYIYKNIFILQVLIMKLLVILFFIYIIVAARVLFLTAFKIC
jgi:hypothetical protein